MQAYAYLLAASEDASQSIVTRIMGFAQRVLPRSIEEIHFRSDEPDDRKIPLSEREAGAEVCRSLQHGDHLVIPDFDVFAHAIDAVEQLGRWLASGVVVHAVDGPLTIAPRSDMAALLQRLRGLDSFTRSFEQSRRKALARKRNKAVNQHAEYGFQYVRGADGQLHKVPHEGERETMRWLLAYKRTWTWSETHAEALERGITSRAGQPPSLKCLRRMHAAAERLAEAGELHPLAMSR